MQRIFYRTVQVSWTDYDSNNKSRVFPEPSEVEKLCAEVAQWAAQNGLRVTSVSPVTASTSWGRNDQAMVYPHTAGFVFVCDGP